MWVVARHNSNEFNILFEELQNKINEKVEHYRPRVLISNMPLKYKYILSDYVFFYNKKFFNTKFFGQLKNLKGLKYFLNFYQKDQNEILNFIEFCKKHEDKNSNIKTSFFENLNFEKIKLISGPFKNLIFSIVESKNKNFIIKAGKFNLTVKKNKDSKTTFIF